MEHKPVNGWIILDKPLGMSSTQASSFVRRLFKADKAGHAGTLDPFATGILPIALNEATKTIPYVVDGRKIYQFQVTWGEQRTTDDREGEVCATSSHRPTEPEIRAALPQFIGKIQQVPPPYSAIKIQGQRAYKLARSGQEVEMKPREVMIYDFQLAFSDSNDCSTFRVECGTGTYVRSLARDLALSLGTVGFVSTLRRLQVGKFDEQHAISLEKLKEIGHTPEVCSALLSIRTVLDDIPAVSVSKSDAQKIRQGQKIWWRGDSVGSFDATMSELVILLENEVVAIAQHDDGWLSPKRVFNISLD